ncbi:MAG: hypothetical protein KDC27_07620 [Acidobacteria bacterium]|nr:hypothetical protein [Acidobacteriota bacterium]
MASLRDLKLSYWAYMKTYRYRSHEWRPGVRLTKPLEQARVAVVTTAALYGPEHEPFDEGFKGGDYTYREIAREADLTSLRIGHRSDAFDSAGLEQDANVALPLDRLAEMARDGRIGEVAPRHFSFMGSIPAPARLTRETAPEAAEKLRADGVDAVLLTPV